jgi:iron complex transport system substrate-binding protein
MEVESRRVLTVMSDEREISAKWRRSSACLGRFISIFFLSATLASVAQAQISVRDDRGAALLFKAPPRRIVSLLPSLTESVCALGACALLVGTDRFSNWPASVVPLPKLGDLEDAQVERIVALKPDVVLVSTSARITDRLEALGLTVVVLESHNHANVKRTLSLLARILGRPAEADRVWAAIERDTRRAAERVPAWLRGKRVYFEVDATLYAAGATSFIGETLTRLGLANGVPSDLGPFPKLNPEYVVRMQPDVVMAAQQNLTDMPRRPGWSALRALQNHQSCGFPSEHYELIIHPGPRLGEAASVLADCLVSIARAR